LRKILTGIISLGLCALALPCLLSAKRNSAEEEVGEVAKKIDSKAIMKAGLDAFYDGRYWDADEKFSQYILHEPDDPVGYLRSFYNRFLWLRWKQKSEDAPKSEANKKENQELEYLISAGIKKSEDKIGRDNDKDFNLYVQAALYQGKAAIEWGNGHPLIARSDLKESLVIAAQSHSVEARYLEGLMNYAGSLHSSWAWLVGLPHSRNDGMRLMCESLKGNTGPYADDIRILIFKIMIDERVKEKDRQTNEKICKYVLPYISAEHLYKELSVRYPHNEVILAYKARK